MDVPKRPDGAPAQLWTGKIYADWKKSIPSDRVIGLGVQLVEGERAQTLIDLGPGRRYELMIYDFDTGEVYAYLVLNEEQTAIIKQQVDWAFAMPDGMED